VRVLPLTLTLLVVAVLVTPAGAQEVVDDPCADEAGTITYPVTRVWFHEGETKVGNLADRSDQAPAPFDTTAPATSVTGGAGAGALSTTGATESLVADTANTARFAGTVEGCLDTLLVEMYAFQPTNRTGTSGSLAESQHSFGGALTIDGTRIELLGPIESKTVPNPGGSATYRIRYAITDIRERMERKGLTLDGLHEIGLEMTAWYVNTDNAVYVWDTTEVPSGMTFNGTVDETYATVRA
jgi:hypothetical protein